MPVVASEPSTWHTIQAGVEYRKISVQSESEYGDNLLHVVRIGSEAKSLQLVLAKEDDGKRRTAGEWCKRKSLAVAINAGMFQSDGLNNVGYMKSSTMVHNRRWSDYQSVLLFKPITKGYPFAELIDRDQPRAEEKLTHYDAIVQNLRLLKSDAQNVWTKQRKAWSEAAIAADQKGKILFLFSRSPFTMWKFNQMITQLDLDIVRAMHVEGGPEASLSVHGAGIDLDLSGSYESGFFEDDSNSAQWPIPNVIGALRED